MISRIIIGLSLVFCATAANATNYYVNNTGDDSSSGTSQTQPWKTIDRVNKQNLDPGDKVLFRGRQTFVGGLYLPKRDSGTQTSPVMISSYGGGAAWISSGEKAGLFGFNVNHIIVFNLYFIGNKLTNATNGVNFYTDIITGTEGVTLSWLDVSGYGQDGIRVGSWGTTLNGYRHVRADHLRVHHNGGNGFSTYAQYPNINQDLYIELSTASYNVGSGILLGGIWGGTVEFSQSYENGRTTDATQSPAGMATYDSTQVVFYNNVSHNNHTIHRNGSGFNLGQSVSLSTLQNNASYKNDGAGYLLSHSLDNDSHTDNELVYNTSTDDSRKLSYGGIATWGRIRNLTVLNNAISLTPAISDNIAAITLVNWDVPSLCLSRIIIKENSFIGSPHLVLATNDVVKCSSGVQFRDNFYQGTPFSILWGSKEYFDLVSWTTATGQN